MNSLFKIVTDNIVNGSVNTDFQITSQSILVKDFELSMSIGIHDFEKEKPQRVIVSLELSIDKSSNPQSDNINEVISYADIVEGIQSLAAAKHYELVETFAQDIIRMSLNSGEQATAATVTLHKPDIMDNVKVGVTMTATK